LNLEKPLSTDYLEEVLVPFRVHRLIRIKQRGSGIKFENLLGEESIIDNCLIICVNL
jgi:hypothetical protein